MNKNKGCSLGVAEVKAFLLNKNANLKAPTQYLASIGIAKVNKQNADKIAGELGEIIAALDVLSHSAFHPTFAGITDFVIQLADENNDGRLEPGEIDESLKDFQC